MAQVQASPAPSTKASTPVPTINGSVQAATNETSSSFDLKRIEVDSLMTEFRNVMGSNWDRYRDVITHFLTGIV